LAFSSLEEPMSIKKTPHLELDKFYEKLEKSPKPSLLQPTNRKEEATKITQEQWFDASWFSGRFSFVGLVAVFLLMFTSFHYFYANSLLPNNKHQKASKLSQIRSLGLLGKGQPIVRMLYITPDKTKQMLGKSLLKGVKKDIHYAKDGEILCPSALIQFHYQLIEQGHLMIVSLNEKGDIFSFVPFQGKKSVDIDTIKGYLPRAGSLELDDYIGLERFFLFWSSRPFSLQELKSSLKQDWKNAHKDLRKMLIKNTRKSLIVAKRWRFFSLLIEKKKVCR
jgi:hypothetical protein